jgi:hypothetical protein
MVKEGKLSYVMVPATPQQAETPVQIGADENFFAPHLETGDISFKNLGSEDLLELYLDLSIAEHVQGKTFDGSKAMRNELLMRLAEYDTAHSNPRD